MRGATTAPVPSAMSRSDAMSGSGAMSRSDTLRIRGSRRGDTITQRLVRTMPERGPSGSTTRAWLAQNLRLAIMAAAAIAAVALSLGTSTRLGPRTKLSRPAGHQSLFASSYNSGGISISHRLSRRRTSSTAGRALADEEGELVTKPLVAYETQLELYLCNPSLVVDGNDVYTVDEARLAAALGRISGLGEATTRDDIKVAIKAGPVDADDDSYMCDTEGMLQWHAQIKYGAEAAATANTTPALMAAQANDYVAYSGDDFKSLLTAYINDEYAPSVETVDLSAADVVVATLGWIVTFPSEVSSTQDTVPASGSGGLAVDLAEETDLWAWWVWLIYGLLVACCLMPLCCFLCRRRKENKNTANEPLATTRSGRKGDGLDKIRGPEWGITELDFDGDHRAYGNEEMKKEYDAAGRATEPVVYKSSQRPGHQSVSGQAWMQERGEKSAWARTSSNSPSTQKNGGGQNKSKSNSKNSTSVARRFDIDEEAADGEEAARRVRGGRHPHYSFDTRAGGERAQRAGGAGAADRQGRRGAGAGESKS